ncbi:MAG: ribonuclease J [Alphaproteobacteria bacterium]|nr:ribonuclease J [Alphaproteobacteria bacterium]
MSAKIKKDTHRPPDDALWLLPLGGSGEIGINLNLYGTAGKWLMVDCGIMFGDESTPGIDIITPDISFIAQRREDLLGIVITHAHEDHLGAIPYLWNELRCPIYATPFAIGLLRGKIAQAGLQGLVTLIEIPLGGLFELDPFKVEMVSVTHSVPDSAMVVIKTQFGQVVHTGDWKLDDDPIVGRLTDETRLKELGHEGILAVVGDSTGAMVTKHTPSEIEVQKGLKSVFASLRQRIVVTCFASNIARVKSIAAVAHEQGRYVSLVGRSLWRNAEIAESLGYLPEFSQFLSEHEAMQAPRDKIVMISTGCQGEKKAALSRIAVFDHPVVVFERGDTVIYSASEIPGNEKPIARVQNLLISQGVHVVTADFAPQDKILHASGHASRADMAKLYGWLHPQMVVTVHGELRHQTEHAALVQSVGIDTVIIPHNGQIIRLGPGLHEVVGEVQSGRWGLDGKNLRFLDQTVTQHRRKMNFNGVAVVTLAIDRRGLVASEPQVTLLGIDDEKALVSLREEIATAVLDGVEQMSRSTLLDDNVMKQAIIQIVRRFLRESQGKKPVIDVHLVRV